MFLFLCFTDKLAVKRNDKKGGLLFIFIYIYIYMYMCMCICMCMCMCMYICPCIYNIYIYIHMISRVYKFVGKPANKLVGSLAADYDGGLCG